MNIKVKISGRMEGSKDCFLVSGKYGNRNFSGVIQNKGKGKALLITHKNHVSTVDKQKIVAYSGGAILTDKVKFEVDEKVEFKETKGSLLALTLRQPRKDTVEDLAEKNAEQLEIIKDQREVQEKTNETLGTQQDFIEKLVARVDALENPKAEPATEKVKEETAGDK
jgi:hypothetical protein